MRRLSLTTWSLHKDLGSPTVGREMPAGRSVNMGVLTLTDVPRQIRDHGIDTLEICHFHFPSVEPDYLHDLRAAAQDARVELFSILVDTGNISNADPESRNADIELIKRWIGVAETLGVGAVRVIAGDSPANDAEALGRSISALREIAEYANERGIRVLTENFRSLASTSENCLRILDELDGRVGLCADIGNFPSEKRVSEFQALAGRISSIHCKASYDSMENIQPCQLRECLDISAYSEFDGPYTLVYDRGGNSWQGIDELARIVAPYASGV